MVDVIMLADAFGLKAGQFTQFTVEEFARLKSSGVCKEIETEVKAAPKVATSKTKTK